MPSESSCNYWVFRDGRTIVPGETVLRELVSSLAELHQAAPDRALDALIRCGELETALADAGSSDANAAAGFTNAAAALLTGVWAADTAFACLSEIAAQLKIPEQVQIATAEGFAYYALHPLAYADIVQSTEVRSAHAAVIGIRSIGATLSAVVTASLARRNVRAERITVRPSGHPYDRRTEFTESQLRWIAANRSHDAEFFVVDEGPGLSGSSFLSVGEALLQAGVERRRIRFLCSRDVDADTLLAPGGAERWRSFQSDWPNGASQAPSDADVNVGGGAWREWNCAGEAEWPASWTYMERVKLLSRDRKRLYKFIGLGRYGAPVEERARLLARTGFGPQFFGAAQGYGEYEVVQGRPARWGDLSRTMLERLADYCAMRATEFRAADADTEQLEQMMRFNYGTEFGEPPEDFRLESRNTVICDARMLPHEWVFNAAGELIKTDGDSHGNDHFAPGPTDIAWDLAGAIVEWSMERDARQYFLQRFENATGDAVQQRIDSYVTAYATFRMGMSLMGAHALSGTPEETRLRNAAAYYRQVLQRQRTIEKPSRASLVSAQSPAA